MERASSSSLRVLPPLARESTEEKPFRILPEKAPISRAMALPSSFLVPCTAVTVTAEHGYEVVHTREGAGVSV